MSLPTPDDAATLQTWLSYLESLHRTSIDLGLERIRAVADKLNMAWPYVKITVGGTNGKGSTCAMLEAILLASGYKTGTYKDRKSDGEGKSGSVRVNSGGRENYK